MQVVSLATTHVTSPTALRASLEPWFVSARGLLDYNMAVTYVYWFKNRVHVVFLA